MIGKTYFEENQKRVKLIFQGCDLRGTLGLAGYVALQSVPNAVRRRIGGLDGWIELAANRLCTRIWVQVNGLRFFNVDGAGLEILRDEFEPFMAQYFTPGCGQTVLDVGANVGKYAFESARAVGLCGSVFAVEPEAANYSALMEGLKANGIVNVAAFNVAASDHDGFLDLYRGLNCGTHSSECNQGKGQMRVVCCRLDGLLQAAGVARLDWVKVDVEGAELAVLQGLTGSLAKFRPRCVVEVWDRNCKEVLTLMAGLGFHALEIGRLAGIDFKTLGGCSYYLFTPAKVVN